MVAADMDDWKLQKLNKALLLVSREWGNKEIYVLYIYVSSIRGSIVYIYMYIHIICYLFIYLVSYLYGT